MKTMFGTSRDELEMPNVAQASRLDADATLI
jgi:hypothetical protein